MPETLCVLAFGPPCIYYRGKSSDLQGQTDPAATRLLIYAPPFPFFVSPVKKAMQVTRFVALSAIARRKLPEKRRYLVRVIFQFRMEPDVMMYSRQ